MKTFIWLGALTLFSGVAVAERRAYTYDASQGPSDQDRAYLLVCIDHEDGEPGFISAQIRGEGQFGTGVGYAQGYFSSANEAEIEGIIISEEGSFQEVTAFEYTAQFHDNMRDLHLYNGYDDMHFSHGSQVDLDAPGVHCMSSDEPTEPVATEGTFSSSEHPWEIVVAPCTCPTSEVDDCEHLVTLHIPGESVSYHYAVFEGEGGYTPHGEYVCGALPLSFDDGSYQVEEGDVNVIVIYSENGKTKLSTISRGDELSEGSFRSAASGVIRDNIQDKLVEPVIFDHFEQETDCRNIIVHTSPILGNHQCEGEVAHLSAVVGESMQVSGTPLGLVDSCGGYIAAEHFQGGFTPSKKHAGTEGVLYSYDEEADCVILTTVSVDACYHQLDHSYQLAEVAESYNSDWLQFWILNPQLVSADDVELGGVVRVGHEYHVAEGDTLEQISDRFGRSGKEIMSMNRNICRVDNLEPGSVICIVPDLCDSKTSSIYANDA